LIGCRAPDQCSVGASVSLFAGDQTEKNGSTVTSGTDGGRNVCAPTTNTIPIHAAKQRNTLRVMTSILPLISPTGRRRLLPSINGQRTHDSSGIKSRA
jgi:hypothetical protein